MNSFLPKTLLVVLCFCCATRCAAQNFGFQMREGYNYFRTTFTTYNNLVIIRLTINGLPMNFVLDSGVRYTMLVQKIHAELLQLEYSRPLTLIGADRNMTMTAQVADGVQVRLEEGIVYNAAESLVVLDEDYLQFEAYFGTEVHGIIGYDLFRAFVIKIDYDNGFVTFYRPSTYQPPKGYVRFDMPVEHTKAYVHLPVVQTNGDTIPCKLMLDSGASFALLLDVYEGNGIRLPNRYVAGDMGRGLGGIMSGYVGRVQSVAVLPSRPFEQVIAFFQADKLFEDIVRLSERHGIIGGELLSRFKVVIDFSGEQLYLKKGSTFRQPFRYNMSGIVLLDAPTDAHALEIAHVVPNSPAEQAGLQQGDVLTRVNDLAGKTMNIHAVRELFKSGEGRNLRIRYVRGQQVRETSLRLKSLL